MAVITEQRAKAILEPHLDAIRDCIQAAWQRWEKLDPAAQFPLSTRSRATCIYDYICHEVRHRFAGTSDVTIQTSHGVLLLNFAGIVLIRFKKLDDSRRGSNIPTRHQRLLSMQLELPELPPEATRLVAGYQLDKLQSSLSDILITCPRGRTVEWFFSVHDTQQVALPFPETVVAQELASVLAPKVRAKNVARDKKRKTSGE